MEKQAGESRLSGPVNVGSPNFAKFAPVSRFSSQAEIEQVLGTLQAHKDHWVQLRITERLSILASISSNFVYHFLRITLYPMIYKTRTTITAIKRTMRIASPVSPATVSSSSFRASL
jgi:hypothetical protein